MADFKKIPRFEIFNKEKYIARTTGSFSNFTNPEFAGPGIKPDMFIAIEITNNSPIEQDLNFTGIYCRQEINESFEIRTIIGSEISDRPDLSALFNLFMMHPIRVMGFVFNTSQLYDQFKNKTFIYKHTSATGQQLYWPFELENYRDKSFKAKQTVITQHNQIIMDLSTAFTQTKIQPGERLLIIFDINGRQTETKLIGLIDRANEIYRKETARKIFLIM